jgi:hypothetical protein
MSNFTILTYKNLLASFQQCGFSFHTFNDFLQVSLLDKDVILRHDVDKLPENSLAIAKIEKDLGISGSYFFRAVPESWNERIIKEISAMGHEIGYHYENLSEISRTKRVRSEEQLFELAFADFKRNLEKLRTLTPVKTICMHGSPLSKWDSRDLWKKYDYKTLGIIGEPYFDVDFSKVFYLTDTGRRWDGFKVSRRDRIPQYQDQWEKEGLVFHSTQNIIDAANKGRLPSQIMITVHPQRWSDNKWHWMKEYLTQNAKNQVKRLLVK